VKDARKILLVSLSNLGDAVLTLPVLRTLESAFPAAAIDVSAGAAARAVFEGEPRVRRFIPSGHRSGLGARAAAVREVRRERYDLIVDLRYSPVGLLGGARARNRYLRFGLPVHRRERHLAALDGIVPPEERFRGAALKARPFPGPPPGPGRLVIAAPGSRSDLKKWPAESFARLLDLLARNDGCRIVLVGDAADSADAARVRSLMVSPAEDLSGRTGFAELCGWIRGAALVVTNDSAPLHLADALGVPSVVPFGPTDPAKYGPRSPGSAAVSKGLFCSPCERAQCRFAHECLEDLPAEEMYRAAAAAALAGRARAVQDGPRILVVRLDRVGDLVLSIPALEALRRSFPDARVSALMRPSVRRLLEGHPAVDEVIAYGYENGGRHRMVRGYFRFIRELRRRRFDAALVLHPGTRSALLPFLAGIPRRVGFDRGWAARLLTTRVPDRRGEGTRHESEYALDIVRAFGARKGDDAPPRLAVGPADVARLERRLGGIWDPGARTIALHPGASCPSKRWPLERFARVGQSLAREGFHIAVVGGEETRTFGESLRKAVGEGVIDLTGRLDLRELAAFLSRCEALVTNDSGPAHVAAAAGAHVVSIFGRNRPGLGEARWRPLGEGHAVVRRDVGCVVCLAHRCPIEFECLKAVTVEEVVAAVLALTGSGAAAR